MAKSWEEVKAVLDDPYVSADTKELLLAAYVHENAGPFGNDLPDEVTDYTDGTKADYRLDSDEVFVGQYVSTDEVYETAQDESDEAGYAHSQNDQNVEEGRTEIEDMRLPEPGSNSNVGAQKSDEIFDAAKDALRIFEDFLPVNDKVPSDSLGRQGKLKFETDIVKRYEEQKGISFKNFLDDANRLSEAYATLSELNSTTETELNNLYREWTGPAANASFQHYSEKIAPNSADLLEYLSTAPEMISTTVENVFSACKGKANDVIALYQSMNGTLGSATPEIADKVVTLANGDFDDQDQVLEVAAWVDSVTGSHLEQTIRDDNCGLNDENKDYVIRECKKWIRDSFNQDLHETLYTSFEQICDDTLEAVNLHYEALNEYLTEYENKFAAAQPPQQPSQPSQPTQPSQPSQPSTPSTPSTPSMPSTPSTPSTPSMPEVPTPPSTTDPSGTDDPTKPGDPNDPNNPQVPTTPGTDQEETVTINDGDREISVTSPDGEGKVTVTVDDGSGKPKTYTLDFGDADPVSPGAGNQPGQPGGAGGQGEFGPNGRPPNAPGVGAPIEPGPDGKCVITDGDLTITAERPEGQPDTVVVTVDDGTGKPTTYNLDYSEADSEGGSGGGAGGGAAGGSGGGGQHAGVRPMPMPLVEANDQVREAEFAVSEPRAGEGEFSTQPAFGERPEPLRGGSEFSTQPAFGERPESLQGGGQFSTQPAFGERPVHSEFSAQPAFGEMPQSLQSGHQAFATSAMAADEPVMSGVNGDGGAHSAGGEAGSFGAPGQSSPYMNGASGEAGLSTAPDSGSGAGGPDSLSGQDQAHAGMAGGGMPMMGGGAGGGAGGGESERVTQWRTTGDLFDEPADPQGLRGAFGGEDR